MNDLAKKLLESIEKPTFVKNKAGTYIGCNTAFEKFLGISKGKILGQTAFEIAPTSLANIYSAADAALFATHSSQIYRSVVSTPLSPEQAIVFHKRIFLGELDEVRGFIGIVNIAPPYGDPTSENLKTGNSIVNLTIREISALELLAKGLTTKEIAKIMLISNFTANDHMKSIFLKLGANSRVTALLTAQMLGLV